MCGLLVFWVAVVVTGGWFRRLDLLAVWREPVLKRPCMVIESDDWGPGPASDEKSLRDVARVLTEFRDREGRHPIATLGVVLGIADRERMNTESFGIYRRVTLRSKRFEAIRRAMNFGVELDVFALHLHGLVKSERLGF